MVGGGGGARLVPPRGLPAAPAAHPSAAEGLRAGLLRGWGKHGRRTRHGRRTIKAEARGRWRQRGGGQGGGQTGAASRLALITGVAGVRGWLPGRRQCTWEGADDRSKAQPPAPQQSRGRQACRCLRVITASVRRVAHLLHAACGPGLRSFLLRLLACKECALGWRWPRCGSTCSRLFWLSGGWGCDPSLVRGLLSCVCVSALAPVRPARALHGRCFGFSWRPHSPGALAAWVRSLFHDPQRDLGWRLVAALVMRRCRAPPGIPAECSRRTCPRVTPPPCGPQLRQGAQSRTQR